MKVVKNITELVGNTPMLKLNKVVESEVSDIYVKLESFNPGSSVKDRIALHMIEKAEEEGKLKKDSVIVEPTSGNTGIGISMIGAAKGYKVKIVMPDLMSVERRNLMKAYGAEIVLTPGEKGMKGAIEKAKELVEKNPNYFMLQQFDNPNNPKAHIKTTAKEILKQMDKKLDVIIAGVGTGGTITGIAEVIKKEMPEVEIVAVEPYKSPVLSGGEPRVHKIQGIGAGFIPKVLNTELIDSIEKVRSEDAMEIMRKVARKEGVLVGISSGAAIYAAIKKAKKLGKGKRIVVIAPDSGERYLSTGIFD
ncbi:cysteine synthase A [Caldisalinibacter kiritimatiensis]|uniref:Cysteine synthase n=1 Tax=Caldisalinibacter kiritimatiensis TaxID=1304284 RepID=R1CVM4_9FIRM|nr:cysteine synthase A [Caldisalinibacter kiritimatiensis]EOD00694.1 Cysteine synthase [Caldisalinibacter kiritimatiensis]